MTARTKTLVGGMVLLSVLACSAQLWAQSRALKRRWDVAVTYSPQRAKPVGDGNGFWLHGGSVALGADLWRGLGVVANFAGAHTSGFGDPKMPLSLFTASFGPRYRFALPSRFRIENRETTIFAEALFGPAHGFDSIFPGTGGASDSATALGSQIGGGIDVSLTKSVALRAFQTDWIRTQFPNAAAAVQHDLRLGAGVVFHLRAPDL